MLEGNIGKKVAKSVFRVGRKPKPFKSGLRENTVKEITECPFTGKVAYTFVEDDSIVRAEICEVVG